MGGPLRRRQLLGLGGLAAVSSVAGCARIEAELGLRAETLGQVVLANGADRPVEVALEVVRNGDEVVFQDSYRLEAGSPEERPQVVLREWRDDPEARRWTVRARVDDGEWADADLDAAVETNCHRVHVVTQDSASEPVLVLPTDCQPQPATVSEAYR